MGKVTSVAGLLVVMLVAASCSSTAPAPKAAAAVPTCATAGLDSTLWLQTAVEAEGLARQAYALATLRLEQALADPRWTAALEQAGEASHLPPAVILDVDETVLDNSAFEARALQRGEAFDLSRWKEWVRSEQAQPVPGALEFCRYAAERGVAWFSSPTARPMRRRRRGETCGGLASRSTPSQIQC